MRSIANGYLKYCREEFYKLYMQMTIRSYQGSRNQMDVKLLEHMNIVYTNSKL